MALSKDRYGIVRVGVLETLGEVLHTFLNDPGGPPNELLELFLGRREDTKVREGRDWMCYTDMEPQPMEQALEFFYKDPERALICAFNFPAVVLTLGASRWLELREYYLDLSRNENVHVRKTMAASLGEIARIIGQEAAQKELVPIWWESLRFKDEFVREKAVEALDGLLPVLGQPVGRQLLEGVLQSLEEGKFRGWREREAIILSLEGYLEALGRDGAGNIVSKLLVRGLRDNVAAVRECVYSVVCNIHYHFFLTLTQMNLLDSSCPEYGMRFRRTLSCWFN
jgi:serine/threonine-protein phosphatase 4 regulatory subunit 1